MHSLEMSIDWFATLSYHIGLPIQQVFENYECEPNSYLLKPRLGFLGFFLYFGCKTNPTQCLKDVGSSEAKYFKSLLIF